jgi:beta-mannosidase
VPRDPGSGWDYDDVCEHYMRLVFGVDPLEVRRTDPERHLALSRAAVCTVMERAFAEWRRAGSETQGALVWFLKDYAIGAGWGVIDGLGFPKAVYYALKRSFANVAVMFTDEGLNGLFAHVINEQAEALEATLELTLYRAGEVMIERVNQGLTLASRTTRALCVDALLSHFVDTSLAYRFGPAGHDLVVARLFVNGEIVSAAFHEPLGQLRALELDLGLHAELVHDALGPCVVVRTRRFAQRVTLEVEGAITDDDAFHLEPGGERRIRFSRLPDKKELRGRVTALNAARVLTLTSGVRS